MRYSFKKLIEGGNNFLKDFRPFIPKDDLKVDERYWLIFISGVIERGRVDDHSLYEVEFTVIDDYKYKTLSCLTSYNTGQGCKYII